MHSKFQWGMPLANVAASHHPILNKDVDIAWRILHKRTVTPQQLHQWSKRDRVDRRWRPGTTDHMCLDCPSDTGFWNRSAKILYHGLLASQPLQKKRILYSYSTLDTTPQHLANCLLVLAKTTICKTYLATKQFPPPHIGQPAHVQHEAATLDTQRNALQPVSEATGYTGKIHNGRSILNEQFRDYHTFHLSLGRSPKLSNFIIILYCKLYLIFNKTIIQKICQSIYLPLISQIQIVMWFRDYRRGLDWTH